MASRNDGYWARSLDLVTRDEGWVKPLLMLAAARLVPIVGSFGADGYALEWARLTAWGVDSAPKQKNVDVAGCIRSGARAFVVALGYGLAFALLRGIVGLVFGRVLGGLASAVLGILAAVVITVAKLRATIYQAVGAGFQVERIIDMVKRDHEGLLRIAGMLAAMSVAVGLAASVLFGGAMLTRIGDIIDVVSEYERYGYADEWLIVSTFLAVIGGLMPVFCVLVYVFNIASSFISLMVSTAVGLWMRQFDVRNWGESADPLPTSGSAADAWQHNERTEGAGSAAYQPVTSDASYEPAPADVQADDHVASFPIPVPLDDRPTSSAGGQESSAQAAVEPQVIPVASEPPVADEASAPAASFSLDDAPAAIETFSLDDVPTPLEVPEAAPVDEPAAQPEASAAEDEAPEIPVVPVKDEPELPEVQTFSLDDVAQEAAPSDEDDVLAQMEAAIKANDLSE